MGGGYHGGFGSTAGSSSGSAVAMAAALVGDGTGHELGINIRNATPIPGLEDVAIHGHPDGFQLIRINPNTGKEEHIDLTQRDLARYLKSSPDYHGGNIRLVSCSTGTKSDGIAQHLANKLGVTVMAPTDTAWVYPNGRIVVGPNQFTDSGTWSYYYPQRKKGDK